ncbi:pilus assembly protein [Pseudoxanthomonas kalamensis DSM 18571]|uniref:pilus assembly PilX family protein n=1 Tax=Pseudoxanthomonas kalamensis TaxID=289483 RepID=UPI0013918359|nr:PilX N-terminal domain-containing pilus assembly protein [Pseudoxanthomonas kalamensis]KAF1709265.1 pilus assembly protein [Pseudoxanthomonas kalamensis DSM 18571]
MRTNTNFKRHSSGASLIVVLILLLIMTLLGLAALRGTLLEERMTANMFDRSINFQAAEAALREGEAVAEQYSIDHNSQPPAVGSGCSTGVCEAPNPADVDRASDPGFIWRTATTAAISDNASPPEFFVEYIGTVESWLECNVDPKYTGDPLCVRPLYRVTARSQGADRASVVLQSNYIAP